MVTSGMSIKCKICAQHWDLCLNYSESDLARDTGTDTQINKTSIQNLLLLSSIILHILPFFHKFIICVPPCKVLTELDSVN